MSEHTKGVWELTTDSRGKLVEIRLVGNGPIAFALDMPQMPVKEYEANARLIAAAPDLLEACKDVLGFHAAGAGLGSAYVRPNVTLEEALEAAIAKAEKGA